MTIKPLSLRARRWRIEPMATAQSPETPVVEAKPAKYTLTPKAQARLHEIKARNAMVEAIAGESWGAKLTPIQQRAFAEYLRRFHLDISEIDNLGGRPYRNGRYYMRRVSELAAQGRVEWYEGVHIGPDDRLAFHAANGEQWATDEQLHRLKECIRLGVPADATVVYVVRIKMIELGNPTEGVKWFAPGREKLGWSKDVKGKREMVPADPVGEENPITSTETRAWRRCGRLAAAEIPELRDQEAEMEYAATATQEAVIAEAVRADDIDARAEITPRPVATTENPFGEDEPAKAIGEGVARVVTIDRASPEEVEKRAAAQRHAAHAVALPDPYDEPTLEFPEDER